jgi:hypothetical protein
MTPGRGPHERRYFRRLPMASRDCRLMLLRAAGTQEREVCTLIDLSYAGLRFRAHPPLAAGETVEFLLQLHSPAHRSGFARAHIRWVRNLGFQECEAGAEFSQESKGAFLGPDEADDPHSGRR